MKFQIIKESRKSKARLGKIITSSGEFQTPVFVPVATYGAVKTLTPKELEELGVEIILANTFHLYLRPGEELISKIGGLHCFMNWKKPIITDSGGFQVFSLGWGKVHGVGKIAKIFPSEKLDSEKLNEFKKKQINKLVKIDNDGVTFTSYLDGSIHRFTPEKSIEIQKKLGADIILAFDECTSPLSDYQYTKKALERTHRWAEKCIKVKKKKNQALFGIVQGGRYKELRQQSAKFISSLPFDGYAIGGALGKSKKEMKKVLNWTIPFLSPKKPRHLLGIGKIDDLKECVKMGIDIFDCVFPTRLARHGAFLTKKGQLNIVNFSFKKDKNPIEKNCSCYTCQNFSRAYLRHLFKVKEVLGLKLATIHNLFFVIKTIKEIRYLILKNKI